ncbi:SH3 domain-containing protein [Streptomyces sp. NPDC015131]|uniref:SH3 domain-containing protein n=1 Tax=Streptomyces sp. NPDC015131 TaxID=3364941 RepID=UPI00370180C4
MPERPARPRRTYPARAAAALAGAVAMVLSTPSPAPAHTTHRPTPVFVWATGVNLRTCPSTGCAAHAWKLSTVEVEAHCQRRGGTVRDGAYANDWWVQVDAGGPVGWVSAVYVSGGGNWEPIPGVSQDFTHCA